MLIILVGKSGCGKSTIEKHFKKMISFTTRSPRDGEVNGEDYYFYPLEKVLAEIPKFKAGSPSFIKQLSMYGENYYGTSEEEVNRIKNLDETVVAVMNLEGAKDMQQIMKDNGVESKIVWVDIDEDIRIDRIKSRMEATGESEEQINNRLNEDYRNEEKKFVDIIIENNGRLEDVLEKIKHLY